MFSITDRGKLQNITCRGHYHLTYINKNIELVVVLYHVRALNLLYSTRMNTTIMEMRTMIAPNV